MSVLLLPAEGLMTPRTFLVILAVLLVWSPQTTVNGRRTLRENVRRVAPLTGYRWSSWYTALVPGPVRNAKNYERRDYGNYGFIVRSIRTRFAGSQGYDDGIYELSVMKKGTKRYVVYIGSAYRNGPGSLSQRILEYCRSGSHKADLINRAMGLGYKLFVRVQSIPGSRNVRAAEKRFLAKYDYAWNQWNNDRIRGNVPPS